MIVNPLVSRFVAVALALLISLSVAGSAAAETVPVTVTVGEGQLSLTVGSTSAVTLTGAGNQSTLAYSSSAQTAGGTIAFTVDDGRSGAAGWNVTAQINALSGQNNATIPATAVTGTTSNVTKLAGSDQLPQAQQPAAIDQTKKMLVAGTGQGAGRYTASLNLSVAVPAYTRPGTYTGQVIISIVAGP